jgi:small subunit ribosomal protein S20
MASHESALKAHRQSVKRRLVNRMHRSRLRSQVKKLRRAITTGDAAGARGMLVATLGLVDRSVKHGVLHRNSAARTKSRLTRAVQKLAAGTKA